MLPDKTVTLEGLNQDGFTVDYYGYARSSYVLESPDKDCSILIDKKTRLLDKNGNRLASLTHGYPVDLPAAPDGKLIIGAHEFGPDGAVFDPSITLVFTYDLAGLAEGTPEEELEVAFWDGSSWQFRSGEVNTEEHTITIKTTHFTIFALMAPLAAPVPPPTPEPVSEPEPAPEPSPEPAPEPVAQPEPVSPPSPAPAPSPSPEPEPIPQPEQDTSTSGSAIPLVMGIIAIIVIFSLVFYLAYRRRTT